MPFINIDSTYGVVIIQDLIVVDADLNYARLYGYESSEELLADINSFLDLIPKEYQDLAVKNFKGTIAGEITPKGHTFTNIDRYGKEFTVFSVDHVIKWQGKPALQVTVIDLSVVVKANQRLRQQDLMFRRLVMNSGQGMIVHRNFKPLMINNAWVKEMRADSIEQVLAMKTILPIIPIEVQQRAYQRYADVLDGDFIGKSHVIENICFDGQRRFFNAYDNVVEWEGEKAIQVVIEDCTDKVHYENLLSYRASHDSLTELLNRSAIYEWLKKLSSQKLTCLLLDIDDFKLVNDTHGHFTGDTVIKALASITKEIVGSRDGVVGRWGGEEFIAFIPLNDITHVSQLAELIRQRFEQLLFISESNEFKVTVSIGVGQCVKCIDMKCVENLIKKTDKALYQAKAQGKNSIQINHY
ncbi:diguanylate cyclase [Shewanella intestini]|uniref:diguanylate cyclase n=1 Tax=Shewanella intestini TaxID=2017544 RepID=A0ABS5HZK7_9GAMM|nr:MULTISPECIES: sensor domain-containing diguanylate cyclase [Shewanella]MBR9727215.1 diguanylate cyclase [Shewanella intestini]MRG36017.1 diguanylate cyclase [Shewanella sp. XMDDZSB0408]